MKSVPLTKGQFALVDDEDYERVMRYKWYASCDGGTWYASRREMRGSVSIVVKMHRFIMNAPDGVEVDHINGSGIDNRRNNMRFATHAENIRNGRIRRNNTTGYKGVSWDRNRNKWQAGIKLNGVRRALGRFDNLEEAARAYDNAARELFGEFARTNFVECTT